MPVNLLVVVGALPNRHRCMRKVWKLFERDIALVLDGIELHTKRLDLLRTHLASFKGGSGVLALAFGFGDLVARCVLQAFESLVLADQPAAQRFERGNIRKCFVNIEAAIAQAGAHVVYVVSNEDRIQHAASAIDSICDLDTALVRCGP